MDLFENELSLGLFEGCHNLLDDMGPLDVARQLQYVSSERLTQELNFLRHVDNVKHALDSMRTPFVAANIDELWLDRSQDLKSLGAVADLDQLLEEIIPVVINHEVRKMIMDLFKEELDQRARAFMQMLLKETAPALVECEFLYIAPEDF